MIERVAAGQDRNFFLRVQVVSMAGLSVKPIDASFIEATEESISL